MLQNRHAVYPGSFDPLTRGHLDIIQRAARCFDRLTIGVGINSSKPSAFSVEDRVTMIRSCTQQLANVEVASFDGLVVDFAAQRQAMIMIRGVRSESDFSFELPMAMMNRNLRPQLEVLFIPTSERFSFISSTLVRDVGRWGGDLVQFIPDAIVDMVKKRLAELQP